MDKLTTAAALFNSTSIGGGDLPEEAPRPQFIPDQFHGAVESFDLPSRSQMLAGFNEPGFSYSHLAADEAFHPETTFVRFQSQSPLRGNDAMFG